MDNRINILEREFVWLCDLTETDNIKSEDFSYSRKDGFKYKTANSMDELLDMLEDAKTGIDDPHLIAEIDAKIIKHRGEK